MASPGEGGSYRDQGRRNGASAAQIGGGTSDPADRAAAPTGTHGVSGGERTVLAERCCVAPTFFPSGESAPQIVPSV